MPYSECLIDQNQLDYIHIWNFARTRRDFDWLNSLQNEHKNIFEYLSKGKKSQLLHEHFIKHRHDFINKARQEKNCLIDIGTRFSINFIGFKQDSALLYVNLPYGKARREYLDDEQCLTAEASKINSKTSLNQYRLCSFLSIILFAIANTGR